MMDRSDLGKRVDWFGARGTVVGMWFSPTYCILLDDGRKVTVAEDRVGLPPSDPGDDSDIHPEAGYLSIPDGKWKGL